MAVLPLQPTPMPALSGRPSQAAEAPPARIREAAEAFEAVFLTQMIGHMMEGIGSDPLTGGGRGEEMFRSVLVDEYGKAIARAGGVGLAEHVARVLMAAQEGAAAGDPP